jgi:hypothetical protein
MVCEYIGYLFHLIFNHYPSRTLHVSFCIQNLLFPIFISRMSSLFCLVSDIRYSPGGDSWRSQRLWSWAKSKLGLGRGVRSKPPRNYHARNLSSKTRGSSKRKAIYFYDKSDPYYAFTNFSPHAVSTTPQMKVCTNYFCR